MDTELWKPESESDEYLEQLRMEHFQELKQEYDIKVGAELHQWQLDATVTCTWPYFDCPIPGVGPDPAIFFLLAGFLWVLAQFFSIQAMVHGRKR